MTCIGRMHTVAQHIGGGGNGSQLLQLLLQGHKGKAMIFRQTPAGGGAQQGF